MNKGGIGVGSASIVLVFAVLCLTVFTLITFIVARNDKALVDAEARLVTNYYSADTLASQVLTDIMLSGGELPEPPVVRGIYVNVMDHYDPEYETVYFICHVSTVKALHVKADVYEDRYEVTSWKLLDTDEWIYDDSLPVWGSDDDWWFEASLPVWMGEDEPWLDD